MQTIDLASNAFVQSPKTVKQASHSTTLTITEVTQCFEKAGTKSAAFSHEIGKLENERLAPNVLIESLILYTYPVFSLYLQLSPAFYS